MPFPPVDSITGQVSEADDGVGISPITIALVLLVFLLCCIWCLIWFLCLAARRRRRREKRSVILESSSSEVSSRVSLESLGENSSMVPAPPPMPHPADSRAIGGRRRTTMMAMKNWLGTALGAHEELTSLRQEMPAPPLLSQSVADDIDRHNDRHAPHEQRV